MSERGRIFLLTAIMAVSTLLTVGITIVVLYRVIYNEQKEQLVSSVKNRARMMESVARFDAVYSNDYPSGAYEATLSQITEAYKCYRGFKKTWEFVIAKKQDDNIVFLMSHRRDKAVKKEPVPWDSKLAEPMRLALSGKSGIIIGRDYAGKEVFAAYEPVDVLNLGIVIKTDLAEVREPFLKAGLTAVVLTLFIVLIGAGLFVRITDPIIDVLERRSEQIKNQNAVLKEAVRKKELEMEDVYEKSLRHEKLAVIGKLVGSIAHELRNPLASVKQSVYYLKRLAQQGKLDSANPKTNEHLELIEAEISTSRKVIDDILFMTRLKPVNLFELNLWSEIQTAVSISGIPDKIQISPDLVPEPFPIFADMTQIRRLFSNIFTNSVHAIEEKGRIDIRARMTDNNETEIKITDTGAGIDSENLHKIFDPLFTTKADGTGLGLCICKQIVENHSGKIRISSESGKGTTVSIVLPELL